MQQDTKRRFQRIYLINRDFQMRYARLGVLVAIGSTVLTLFLVLYPLFELRLLRFPNFLPNPFLFGIGFAAVLNLALIAVFTVLMTHKVAGPMFSLVRHMRDVQAGHYSGEMRARAGDDMKFVVRHFNEMVEALRLQTAQDQDKLESLTAALKAGRTAEAVRLAEALTGEFAQRIAVVAPKGAPA